MIPKPDDGIVALLIYFRGKQRSAFAFEVLRGGPSDARGAAALAGARGGHGPRAPGARGRVPPALAPLRSEVNNSE